MNGIWGTTRFRVWGIPAQCENGRGKTFKPGGDCETCKRQGPSDKTKFAPLPAFGKAKISPGHRVIAGPAGLGIFLKSGSGTFHGHKITSDHPSSHTHLYLPEGEHRVAGGRAGQRAPPVRSPPVVNPGRDSSGPAETRGFVFEREVEARPPEPCGAQSSLASHPGVFTLSRSTPGYLLQSLRDKIRKADLTEDSHARPTALRTRSSTGAAAARAFSAPLASTAST